MNQPWWYYAVAAAAVVLIAAVPVAAYIEHRLEQRDRELWESTWGSGR